MLTALKRILAKRLYPDAFADAARYHFLRSELSDAHRWLGESQDIRALTEWLNARETSHWRKLDDPPTDFTWEWSIDRFREQLRKRRDRPSVVPGPPDGPSIPPKPVA